MKIDIDFLKQLKQKLQFANRNSIYLNALPGNRSRKVDVWNLNYVQPNMHNEFLEQLLTKEAFRFVLSIPTHDMDKRTKQFENIQELVIQFQNIINDENEFFKDKGYRSFALGYPMLIKRDSKDADKLIKAPVFIWKLQIEQSKTKANTFIISRESDDEIVVNPILLNYLEANEQLSLRELQDAIEQDNTITFPEILQVCNTLLKALQMPEVNEPLHVVQAPENHVLQALENNKTLIRFCGTFGLFQTAKQSIVNEIDFIIQHANEFENKAEQVLEGNTAKYHFPLISIDPSQYYITQSIAEHSKVVVQGPPGTGKSRLLTAVISKALLNGEKTLVVCEKKTALAVLQQNLSAIGLADLTEIIEEVNDDRMRVVTKIRKQIEEVETEVQNEIYSENLQKLNSKIASLLLRLNEQKKLINAPIFQRDTYKDMVAKYMTTKSENQILLHSNAPNYEQDVELIDKAEGLYNAISTHLSAFDVLNKNYISAITYVELYNQTNTDLPIIESLLQKGLVLIQTLREEEKNNWIQTYQTKLKLLQNKVQHLLESDIKHVSDYGDSYTNFEKGDGFMNQLSSLFSAKTKQANEAKRYMQQQFEQILFDIQPMNDVIKLVENYDIKNRNQLIEILQTKSKEIEEIQADLPNKAEIFIQKRIVTDTANNQHFHTFTSTASELNNKLAHKMYETEISLNKGFAEVETQLTMQIEAFTLFKNNLSKYREMYEWQVFYNAMSKPIQENLGILIEEKAKKWKNIFNHNFYKKLLIENDSSDRVIDEFELQQLIQMLNEYAKNGIEITKQYWKQKQKDDLQNATENDISIKNIYALRDSNKRKKMSLRKIVQTNLDFFTNCNPVLLVNPVVAAALLPFIPQYFDYVILDEASQLKLEDTYTALLRGSHVIITGDSHQMPPADIFSIQNAMETDDTDDLSQSTSLLEFAENEQFKQFYLDFHYRSEHPDLISFSNSAFYGSRLMPLPPLKGKNPFTFIQKNGIYNANEGINEAEAQQVLALLQNEISVNSSVGIATLNLYQRDYILKLIQKKRLEDETFATKLQQLEQNGLFVKNLENIQGDERDVIIVSTTFGNDENGNFRQSFGPLNQQKGYKLLNVLITRAKQQIFVINSIPTNIFQNFATEISDKGNYGKAIFYAYLSYAYAAGNNMTEVKNSLLQLMFDKSLFKTVSSKSTSSKLFEQYIGTYFSEKNMTHEVQKQYGGLSYALQVNNTLFDFDSESEAIMAQSVFAEIHKKQIAERLQKKYTRLYTRNLWLQFDEEIQKWIN